MIHVIMGLKGSGKTKRMIDAINEAVANVQGDVVCIEYGNKLTYDVAIVFVWSIPRSMALIIWTS